MASSQPAPLPASRRAPAVPVCLYGFLQDRELANTIKGILIVAIAFGHNRILTDSIPHFFVLLYFWHVQGFFFLAFASRGFTIGSRSVPDTIARYLVPFVLLTGLLLLVRLALQREPGVMIDWLGLLYSGAAARSEATLTIQLFWFLPAFTSFMIAQIWLSRLVQRTGHWSLAIIAVLSISAFLAAYFLPNAAQLVLPWCAGLALYLLPLSIVFAAVCYQVIEGDWRRRALLGLGAALVTAVTAWLVVNGHPINVAIFGFGHPLGIALVAAAGAVGANLIVVLVSLRLRGSDLLRHLGRNSLQIYLFHIFVQYALYLAFKRFVGHPPLAVSVVSGILVTTLAIGISLAIAHFITRLGVNTILFPKDFASFRAAFRGWRQQAG